MRSDSSRRLSGRTFPWASIVVAMLLACVSPTESCGCSPMPLMAVLMGEVTDPMGTAVAGAIVRAELAAPGCAATKESLGTATSDAAGHYRVDLAMYGPATVGDCLHVWAEPPAGTALLSSVAVPFSIVFSQPPATDSVEINLTLRSPAQ